jgi:hypothetical protein
LKKYFDGETSVEEEKSYESTLLQLTWRLIMQYKSIFDIYLMLRRSKQELAALPKLQYKT